MILQLRLSTVSSYFLSKTILNTSVFLILNFIVTQTLTGITDHSNYTFKQAGYNTAGRGLTFYKLNWRW
jgi:hypothetical protein